METATAISILEGPEYFTCERHGCRMRKEVCVRRQTGNHSYDMYCPDIWLTLMSLEECEHCAQGARLLEEFVLRGLEARPSTWRVSRRAALEGREERDGRTPFGERGGH